VFVALGIQRAMRVRRIILTFVVCLTRVECMYLSNATLFGGKRYVDNKLHKVQLHVSALDNGHLQVVHEIVSIFI